MLALITGARSGIGLQYATELAKQKHDLILVSNQEKEIVEAAQTLSHEYGIKAVGLYRNLATSEAAEELHSYCKENNYDIDILIMGFIDNLIFKNVKTKNYGVVNELEIKSFICNVELKSHTATAVKREGTDYIVFYSGIPHNASQQCSEAKFSILRHIEDQLSIKPFICDILWFNGLSKADIVSMRGSALDNGLHSGFKFKDFINVILQQANVRKETGKIKLDCFNNGEKEYHSIINLFSAERKPLGLTKQKFELLSQKDNTYNMSLKLLNNNKYVVDFLRVAIVIDDSLKVYKFYDKNEVIYHKENDPDTILHFNSETEIFNDLTVDLLENESKTIKIFAWVEEAELYDARGNRYTGYRDHSYDADTIMLSLEIE